MSTFQPRSLPCGPSRDRGHDSRELVASRRADGAGPCLGSSRSALPRRALDLARWRHYPQGRQVIASSPSKSANDFAPKVRVAAVRPSDGTILASPSRLRPSAFAEANINSRARAAISTSATSISAIASRRRSARPDQRPRGGTSDRPGGGDAGSEQVDGPAGASESRACAGDMGA